MYDWLGYTAGFFYVTCYIPQILEIFYKKTDKLNNLFLYLQLAGASFMIAYSIINDLLPILILNSITFMMLCIILRGSIISQSQIRSGQTIVSV